MNICFIGGGNMARAILTGLMQRGWQAANLSVVEQDAEKRQALQADFGIAVSAQLPIAADAEVVILAVKPQQLRDVAVFLGSLLQQQLVISIAAGARCADLTRWLGNAAAVVRVMPNTPAQVQAGISALFATPGVSAAQRQAAETILQPVGRTLWLEDESLMDAVTALSGSGPAYVFYFLEAMQQAGVEMGLDSAQARCLALETFQGAARLAAASPLDFATLRAQVTSKGGTTERALERLEQSGVKEAFRLALHAAADRSRELGAALGRDS